MRRKKRGSLERITDILDKKTKWKRFQCQERMNKILKLCWNCKVGAMQKGNQKPDLFFLSRVYGKAKEVKSGVRERERDYSTVFEAQSYDSNEYNMDSQRAVKKVKGLASCTR